MALIIVGVVLVIIILWFIERMQQVSNLISHAIAY